MKRITVMLCAGLLFMTITSCTYHSQNQDSDKNQST